MTNRRIYWSVESHLGAIDAPPAPPSGKGRVVKVYRAERPKDRKPPEGWLDECGTPHLSEES